jgi:RsiW-degrading membrane proteinase PrsW (M82 family)
MMPQPTPAAGELTPPDLHAVAVRRRSGPSWRRFFATGLGLWLATVLVTFVTGNSNLIPAIILVGSFLVPVTFVTYALARTDEVITAQRLFTAFAYGGLLGVLGASVLESAFLGQPSALTYVGVGLIEEAVKLVVLWMLARRLGRYTVRDGMVLGAAVGFGFAAFESAGYAFNALFTPGGLSLLNVVETEVLRGILTPVGHGLWTAILGGVLFGVAARRGRLRLTGSVLGWYLVVALLHCLWDASAVVAVWLTLLLTGTPMEGLLSGRGRAPAATAAQVHLFTTLNWSLLVLDAVVGLLILLALRRRAVAGTAAAGTAATGAAEPVREPGR